MKWNESEGIHCGEASILTRGGAQLRSSHWTKVFPRIRLIFVVVSLSKDATGIRRWSIKSIENAKRSKEGNGNVSCAIAEQVSTRWSSGSPFFKKRASHLSLFWSVHSVFHSHFSNLHNCTIYT